MRYFYNASMFAIMFVFVSFVNFDTDKHISVVSTTPSTIKVNANLPELEISYPAEATAVAVRLIPPEQIQSIPTTIPVGIFDLPFAPEGLSDCDEFDYYRTQFGLPERFNALAWRESNCRNEDDVKTWCCHGYLQLYISLQIQDYRITDRYHLCGVWSSDDVNSDTPLDKQRQVCAAAVLYDVVGYSAWAL